MKTITLLSALIISSSAMLTGCATTAPQRGETAGEFVDDATTTTQVNALIVKDKDASFFKIDVTTTQGDVVLQGHVNSSETTDRLVTKIQALRGVKSVKSLLKVEEKKL
jgi:osmotically-inducible protein OsmY